MDVFLEQLVKRKRTAGDYVKMVLVTLAAVLLTVAVLAVNMIFARYLMGMGILLVAAVWYGYYLAIQFFSVEYEYTLTNSDMDIDKIMSKKGRKSVTSVDFREIEICARVNDEEYKGIREKTDNFARIFDVSGDINADNVYFADYHTDGGKYRIYFRPTEKMIDAIYKFNPRAVHK